MAARRFLTVFAGLIVLALAAVIIWAAFGGEILKRYMTPSVTFAESPAPPPTLYDRPDAWIARPGIPSTDANWTPDGYRVAPETAVSIFYVHPTTYLKSDRWNAPLDPDDEGALYRRGIFTRSQASVFNGVGDIWAPKYRQAAFGAFLSFAEPDAAKSFALAYRDVETSFDSFLASLPEDRPIILAGHSQGSLHLVSLLARRIAGTAVADRIVAAYLPGWPISVTADLPKLGLAPCTSPAQTRCLLAWQSFAEPADMELVLEAFDLTKGFDGTGRAGTDLVCTNPQTGGAPGPSPAEGNIGALVPDESLEDAVLQAGLVQAECRGRGYLSLGENALSMGQYVLPGNNYHVYDYALFWANLRADAERRTSAFLAR
ncbi:DUF3089 domain-containing protein [Pacificimonas sp. WHA3]|uniref:DUF3089 domain-containing protein n=2 Tax=Pacificimonas pallii TaxID=2827236 RepID=A0ABS6SDA5_9SPHN|nr:DUF3089 domain-containing protein [Pacificimonas pallii]MBV7256402.1 DUF3089 domain-containing protein [Pacificimonas pallii]